MRVLSSIGRCALLVVSVLLFGISCVKENLEAPVDRPVENEVENPTFFSGEMMVKFTDDMINEIEADLTKGNVVTKSSGLNDIVTRLGVRKMERLFPYAGEFEERTRAEGLHRWYIVSFDENIPVTKASVDFRDLPGIEEAGPAYRPVINDFDDPYLKDQWHYVNDGTLTGIHKKGSDINVEPVWENFTTGVDKIGDMDVIVAVIDGGIDMNHEDLKDRCIPGFNFVSNINTIRPHDHGTHVAGTIGAINNNGIGVCGIAGGDAKKGQKGVKLLSCQIFETGPDGKDKGTSQSYSAIKWAADHGAVIAQNSWGAYYEKKEDMLNDKAYFDKNGAPGYIKDAVDYFIKYAGTDKNGNQTGPMKGGVVIFAAGNDGWDWSLPGAVYDPIINVGSIGPDFGRAYYSNYGKWVDVCAPGGDANKSKGGVLSTVPGNKYAWFQGTSMACPHVSGVAALLVSYFGGPGFTNEMLTKRLLEGADPDKVRASLEIGPLVDAYGAFTKGSTIAPDPVQDYKAEAISNSIVYNWKVSRDRDDKKAHGFLLLASEDESKLEGLDPRNLPSGVKAISVDTGSRKVGEEISGTLTGLQFNRKYFTTIFAFDNSKNYSDGASVKSVTTGKNNSPVIRSLQEGAITVPSHVSLQREYEIKDPDGHSMKVTLVAGSKALTMEQNPSTQNYILKFVGNDDAPGKYVAELKAIDEYGAETVLKINYEILPNHAPVIKKQIGNMIFTRKGEKFTLDMTEFLEDPDGEQLRFEVSISNRKVLHINPTGNILNATVLGYGFVDVNITALDSRNEKCVLVFTVLVKDKDNIVEVFPNPVIDFLNVRTGESAETEIRIVSASGRVFYLETSEVSAADPARIDMTTAAPGNYVVRVTIDGNAVEKRIVKL